MTLSFTLLDTKSTISPFWFLAPKTIRFDAICSRGGNIIMLSESDLNVNSAPKRSLFGEEDSVYLVRHPATYSDVLLPVFARLLQGTSNVLDPFAGTCKLTRIKGLGYVGKVICNEIEPEWAEQGIGLADEVHIGDAQHMQWAKDEAFDAICTSPTYGNRMADHHHARDKSHRVSYTHLLGRPLSEANTGKLYFHNPEYKVIHENVWKECWRVLRPNGILILNISDHIRHGAAVPVTAWHKSVLERIGFVLEEEIRIPTPRMRFGSNNRLRIPYEFVCSYRKP
jgi:SAM-dependent methyltransferase